MFLYFLKWGWLFTRRKAPDWKWDWKQNKLNSPPYKPSVTQAGARQVSFKLLCQITPLKKGNILGVSCIWSCNMQYAASFILFRLKGQEPIYSTEANGQGQIHIHMVKLSEPSDQEECLESAFWKSSLPVLTPQQYLGILGGESKNRQETAFAV